MEYFTLCIFLQLTNWKTISTVDRPVRNPHCDSGYTRSSSCCSRTCITRIKILPTTLKKKILMYPVQSVYSPLVLNGVIIWYHACPVGIPLPAIIGRKCHARVIAGLTCMSWLDGMLWDPSALLLVKWSMALLSSLMVGTESSSGMGNKRDYSLSLHTVPNHTLNYVKFRLIKDFIFPHPFSPLKKLPTPGHIFVCLRGGSTSLR